MTEKLKTTQELMEILQNPHKECIMQLDGAFFWLEQFERQLKQLRAFYKTHYPKNLKNVPSSPSKAYFFAKVQLIDEILGEKGGTGKRSK